MKRQYVVLMLCSLGYVMSLMSRSAPAVLSEYLVADLAFTASTLGLVSASTMISYGIMQLPAGVLADLYGPRKVLIAFTLIAGLSTIFFALATSPTQVILARFFIGVGVSLSVISITMVSLWFSSKTFARANSILCAISEFGPVLAASPLVLFIGLVSWRGAMLSMGIVILALTFFWFFFIPENAPYAKPKNEKASFKSAYRGVLTVFKNKQFWPLCLWQMLATGSIYVMVNLWVVPYFVNTANYSVLKASFIISVAGICLIGIQASVGFLSDMVFKSRKKVLLLISFSFFISTVLLVFGVGKLNYFLNFIMGIMLMSGVAGSNICNTMIKENFPQNLTGTALGCFNMFYPLWTAIVQISFGFILTLAINANLSINLAYAYACAIILICGLLAMACALMAKETYDLKIN